MIDKDFLIDRYLNKQLPVREIAKELGLRSTGYVCYCLDKHNIPRRIKGRKNIPLTKEFFEEQYVKLRKRAKAIAKEFKIRPREIVMDIIRSHGIPKHANSKKLKNSRASTICQRYYSALVYRADKIGIEFNISKEYLLDKFNEQGGKCGLSGVEIYFTHICPIRGILKQTASLDRIDSEKGYTKGNVQWVHKIVNKMKQNLKDEEFISWCHIISNNHYDKYLY